MKRNPHSPLSWRERQIMDVLYERGRATAAQIQEDLPDPPGYSAVRALLAKLVAKGHVAFEYDGPRHVYQPTVPRESAREPALDRLVDTFFEGSPTTLIAALLDRRSSDLSDDELSTLVEMIEDARRRGR